MVQRCRKEATCRKPGKNCGGCDGYSPLKKQREWTGWGEGTNYKGVFPRYRKEAYPKALQCPFNPSCTWERCVAEVNAGVDGAGVCEDCNPNARKAVGL